jgi:quercetin dioxygenase-like cupin family protein
MSGTGALAASFLPVQAQNNPAKTIFQHDLPDLTLKDWSVTAVEVSYGPGDSTPSHSHPGITIAYVLEGEVRSKVGDAPEQTYSVGQMFLETPGQTHSVSGNASKTRPAKLLAILLAENGKPLTTFTKE